MSISSFVQYYFGIVDSILLTADQRGYIQYNAQTKVLVLNTISLCSHDFDRLFRPDGQAGLLSDFPDKTIGAPHLCGQTIRNRLEGQIQGRSNQAEMERCRAARCNHIAI